MANPFIRANARKRVTVASENDVDTVVDLEALNRILEGGNSANRHDLLEVIRKGQQGGDAIVLDKPKDSDESTYRCALTCSFSLGLLT